jgi:TRAP-type C4-dicarboxylate transport system permease small subunit
LTIIDPNTPMQSPDHELSLSVFHKVQIWLYRIEDAILVGLLLLMILMAVAQILLRNFLGIGIASADILVRILVLWVGLVGAMAASRKGDHIKIDLISKYLKTTFNLVVTALTDFFTAIVCAIVVYYSIILIRFEYMDGNIAFGRIPVWFCQAIIPFAFLVMAIRYVARAIHNLKAYYTQKVP